MRPSFFYRIAGMLPAFCATVWGAIPASSSGLISCSYFVMCMPKKGIPRCCANVCTFLILYIRSSTKTNNWGLYESASINSPRVRPLFWPDE